MPVKPQSALPSDRSYLLDTLRSLKDLIDDPGADRKGDTAETAPASTPPSIKTSTDATDDAWMIDIPVLENAVAGPISGSTEYKSAADSSAMATAFAGHIDLRAAPIPELGAPVKEPAPQIGAQGGDATQDGNAEPLLDPVAMADRAVELIDAKLNANYERRLPAELATELRQMLYVFLNEWIEGTERSLHRRLADRTKR
ncbi:MAG: hypothetical protein OEQ39_07025 [Gammaproteobacteria bacterium]|nr:hypothetical protein [Gammaproteobacteria bacterium]MDH3466033.1 hypothetical protein [Gammaproteobacteria bacterium]